MLEITNKGVPDACNCKDEGVGVEYSAVAAPGQASPRQVLQPRMCAELPRGSRDHGATNKGFHSPGGKQQCKCVHRDSASCRDKKCANRGGAGCLKSANRWSGCNQGGGGGGAAAEGSNQGGGWCPKFCKQGLWCLQSTHRGVWGLTFCNPEGCGLKFNKQWPWVLVGG